MGAPQRVYILGSSHSYSRDVLEGGGDGGGRALPLPLPLEWGGKFDGKPLALAMPGHMLELLPVKPRGTIPTLPRETGGEEDP